MKTAMGLTAGVGAVLAAMLWTAEVRGEEVFSPRGFCEERGGAVLEAGDPDIHVCCYVDRQRCIEVNERSRTSRRVALPGGLTGHVSVVSDRRRSDSP